MFAIGNNNSDYSPEKVTEVPMKITLDASDVPGYKTMVRIGIFENGEKIKTIETTFTAPARSNNDS